MLIKVNKRDLIPPSQLLLALGIWQVVVDTSLRCHTDQIAR